MQRSLPQVCSQDWLLSYFAERAESMMVDPAQFSHAGNWRTQPETHWKLLVEMITHHWGATRTDHYMHKLSTC